MYRRSSQLKQQPWEGWSRWETAGVRDRENTLGVEKIRTETRVSRHRRVSEQI